MRGRGAKRRTSSEYSKRTRRNVSGTSQRQFEIPTPKSQSAGMESGRNQEHCFLTCCQKVLKWGSEKGSLNRPIPALKLFERCSLLDPSKSKVQTASRQKRWGTLHIPLAKINYSPEHTHTHTRKTTDFLVPTDGKSASRNNYCIWNYLLHNYDMHSSLISL